MIENVDEILAATEIDEVIGQYVTLKRKGHQLIGLCPFHDEKSGSFTVSESRQMYKCFGCGKSGNAITFLMEHQSLGFIEAVKRLAHDANVTLKEGEGSIVKSKETIAEEEQAMKLNGQIKRLYHRLLMENADALKYLTDRGLTTETIALWELGYAPAEWTTVKNYIMDMPDKPLSLAIKLGLVVEKDDKNRDYFYNRIIFPINDENGNTLSFAGRIWTEEQHARKDPKYLNGPGTFIYDKSNVLFGLDKARMIIGRASEAIQTEGYLDVIMSHQHGINLTVGTCGTAVTERQVKKLVRLAKTIYIAQDGDAAGIKSTIKAIDLYYTAQATDVYVIDWASEGEDLDSWLRKINDVKALLPEAEEKPEPKAKSKASK